ncbi:MAG TPA: glutathione S-transferase family protein [Myxococcota bacterium]
MITLYGTTTSPFVRRVRAVCIEAGRDITFVPTQTDDGQAQLRRVSPIWKVPVAAFADGRVVYDSRVIIDEIVRDGSGTLRADSSDVRGRVDEENVITMIDEALLALVRRFYTTKDGGSVDNPWFEKERARVATILEHLDSLVVGQHLTARAQQDGGFGRVELAVVTALDWMAFRNTFDLATVPKLRALASSWASRPSLSQTAPTT